MESMTDKSGTVRAPAQKIGAERMSAFRQRVGGKPGAFKVDPGAKPVVKPTGKGHGFKAQEFIVYPAHGVGQIVAIEEEEVAGFKLELFVISFAKDKMKLKVPVPKAASVGMRKLSEG